MPPEAQVYKALRNSVEPVAVKVMKGQQDQRTQARFSQEIELLRRIRHANIVMCAPSPGLDAYPIGVAY